jgi:LiaI-LiaF-like transmembrane region
MTMRPGAIVAGVILLGVGIAMLLDNTGILRIRLSGLVAPLILIAMGSAIVLDRGCLTAARRQREEDHEPRPWPRRHRRGGSTGGFWLIGVGVWMLLSQTHMFGLNFGNSWPLLVIFAGLIVVMRGMR